MVAEDTAPVEVAVVRSVVDGDTILVDASVVEGVVEVSVVGAAVVGACVVEAVVGACVVEAVVGA